MTMPETKLVELRGKTDRQLIALIERELDRGLSSDRVTAEQAYSSAQGLLTVAHGASYDERRKLELKLACLGEFLSPAWASVA